MANSSKWTVAQKEEGTFFDEHWAALVASGKIDLVIPPDEDLFQQDLGRSLAYMAERLGDLQDYCVLEMGCGPGDFTIFLARRGAIVEAIDVAPSALKITRRRAEVNGVTERVHTHLMPAERLDFEEDVFDWVTGFGLLHHVDLELLGPEIHRVLKPGGRALFREPLGTNPILEFARRYLPYQSKYHSEHERPLTYDDIEMLERWFQTTHVREFYLLSSFSRLMKKGEASAFFRFFYALDEFLLRRVHPLRSLCRYVVVEFGT